LVKGKGFEIYESKKVKDTLSETQNSNKRKKRLTDIMKVKEDEVLPLASPQRIMKGGREEGGRKKQRSNVQVSIPCLGRMGSDGKE